MAAVAELSSAGWNLATSYNAFMLVKELIAELGKFDGDLPVTLDGAVEVSSPTLEMVWPGDYKPQVPVVTFGINFDEYRD